VADRRDGEAQSFEHELDELYSTPPPLFIAARNELVKRLRAAGDREGAALAKALRKPTQSAFAINRLHQDRPELLEELTAAGDSEREVLRSGGGAADQERARGQRRKAVEAAEEAALEALEAAALTPSDTTRRQLLRTIEALAAFGSVLPTAGPGRLEQDLEPPGFEVLAGLALTAARPRARPEPRPTPRAKAVKSPPSQESPVAPPRRETASRHQQRIRQVQRDLKASERALAAADKRSSKADEQLALLRSRLDAKRIEVAERHRELTSARRQHDRLAAELQRLERKRTRGS
jgi:septal ring factor EnvC (AmiA/AmiB activator)